MISGAHVCPLYSGILSIAHCGGAGKTPCRIVHSDKSFDEKDETLCPVE